MAAAGRGGWVESYVQAGVGRHRYDPANIDVTSSFVGDAPLLDGPMSGVLDPGGR